MHFAFSLAILLILVVYLLPGRAWWVTTSILRFDPDAPWATDLNCTMTVNPKLCAWDHTPFQLNTSQPLTFLTESLGIFSQGVTSALATAATGGSWSPTIAGERVPECPRDCQLALSFSVGVDLKMMQKAPATAPCVVKCAKRSSEYYPTCIKTVGECRAITLSSMSSTNDNDNDNSASSASAKTKTNTLALTPTSTSIITSRALTKNGIDADDDADIDADDDASAAAAQRDVPSLATYLQASFPALLADTDYVLVLPKGAVSKAYKSQVI